LREIEREARLSQAELTEAGVGDRSGDQRCDGHGFHVERQLMADWNWRDGGSVGVVLSVWGTDGEL